MHRPFVITLRDGRVMTCATDGRILVALQTLCGFMPPAGECSPESVQSLQALIEERNTGIPVPLRDLLMWCDVEPPGTIEGCPECRGRGLITCAECHGQGHIQDECEHCGHTHECACPNERCHGGEVPCRRHQFHGGVTVTMPTRPGKLYGVVVNTAYLARVLYYLQSSSPEVILQAAPPAPAAACAPPILLEGTAQSGGSAYPWRVVLMPMRQDTPPAIHPFGQTQAVVGLGGLLGSVGSS